MAPSRADLVELRVLDGPNLYFPRPAIKLTLGVEGWLALPKDRVEAALSRAGVRGRAGTPRSDQRRRTTARLGARLTGRLAAASGVRLAVRGRPGPEPDQVVVAFPWRRRGSAEALGREV
ncbi:MAG TPA: Mur ligase, partial [Actinomycetota bacterium]